MVLREDGPTPASELSAGDRVLCMQNGAPTLISVARDAALQDGPAIWICTDAGDLTLGANACIATSEGIAEAGVLAARRNKRAIGRMEGDWPTVEALTSNSGRSLRRHFDEATLIAGVRRRLLALSKVPGGDGDVYRAGSHSQRSLSALTSHVFQCSSTSEPGPAGWTWISPESGRKSKVGSRPSVDEVAIAALALWQAPEDGDGYLLPATLDELRACSLSLLHLAGQPFSAEYRPRYLPSRVELALGARGAPHARVQSVNAIAACALVDVLLETKGTYLIANGLLCAR